MMRTTFMPLLTAFLACAVTLGGCGPFGRDANAKTFQVKGVTLSYSELGTGEPVVLIHGLHSSAALNWQLPGISGEIAKRYKVIMLDLPGHGSSDKPTTEEAYGAQMAEDVAALLDHLQIKQAHIVGYSMGGMIAMKLMSAHPEKVKSTLLGGMGWLKEGSGLQGIWRWMGSGPRGNGSTGAVTRSLAKLALTEEQVKAIRVPIQIVVGDRDPVKGLYVDPLRIVRPDWKVVEVENAGHIDCILKPQFRDEVIKWLDRQSRSDRSAK